MLNYREHHLLMPGVSCGGSGGRCLSGGNADTPVSAARWSVPIDDTHTIADAREVSSPRKSGKYEGDPLAGGQSWRPPRDFIVPYRKRYRDSDNPVFGYNIPPLHFIEDGMVVDSMPPVADRENENLGPTIDDGIIKLRQMYLREIEKGKTG